MLWTQGCVGFTPLKEVTAVVNSFYASVNFTFWCFPWFCCWLVLLMWIACIEVGCVEPVLVRSSSAKKRKGHCNQNRRMKLSACIINVFEKKQLLISMCWFAFNLLNVSGPHNSFSTFLFWGFMILQGNWDIHCVQRNVKVIGRTDLKLPNPMNPFGLRLWHDWIPWCHFLC